jgi:hypothetical protein
MCPVSLEEMNGTNDNTIVMSSIYNLSRYISSIEDEQHPIHEINFKDFIHHINNNDCIDIKDSLFLFY